jgi:valyl-tRNA synthetase
MEKHFDPKEIEAKWYQNWENNGYFKPSQSSSNGTYSIVIPPPNVTGSLHMGHAFQDTIMDTLVRYHRMKGDETLWQPGTDHAGIATQMVVERQLAAQGITRHDIGREEFINKVWQWKAESGNTITKQLRRLGASADWSRERFTMDDGLSTAVKEVFVRLHKEGLIYRGKRLVNWDPVLHTAVSDLEVISTEENGYLWQIKYPLTNGSGYLIVATTRPETMFGDQAVAVHPDDERYQDLIGETITLPLVGRKIPIIADDYVDMEFGTGCVKITPAHDFNDYEMGKRYNLSILNIMTDNAAMNNEVPDKYQGLDRFVARKQVIKDLEALKLLDETKKHKLMVPRGDRSNSVIEPYLTDQWYVAITELAKPAIDAVKNGNIEFIPKNWENTYFEWMNNIQDWCISRQIWWGHRIPAWYDDKGNIFVGKSEQEVRTENNLSAEIKLKQDDDVLDTWFSSALWSFSTLGWPEKTVEMQKFHPTSVLVTGFDIIFFWVARMIMMSLKFTGEVPFKQIYVHGLVRDGEGQKMSKSKGNVLDPIDLIDGITLEELVKKRTSGMMQPEKYSKIEKATRKQFADGIDPYGTDAVRFTFASLASNGRDIRFDLNQCEGYRNFCNKIWNATRYVLMNTKNQDTGIDSSLPTTLSLADKWIVSKLQQVEADVDKHFSNYRLDLVANSLYEFIWSEYCDWYLELSKATLNSEDSTEEQLRGTRKTLVGVLETILRLIHPIIPFISEEAWQVIAPLAGKTGQNNASIMLQKYPKCDYSKIDAESIEELEWVKDFISGIRKIRSEMNIIPSKKLSLLLEQMDSKSKKWLDNNKISLILLAKLESITILSSSQIAPESAVTLVGNMKILIPMAGLIDKQTELQRLNKEVSRLSDEIKRFTAKLSNTKFVTNAPKEIILKEKQKLLKTEATLKNIKEQHEKINNL